MQTAKRLERLVRELIFHQCDLYDIEGLSIEVL